MRNIQSCKNILRFGKCDFKGCKFAHTREEVDVKLCILADTCPKIRILPKMTGIWKVVSLEEVCICKHPSETMENFYVRIGWPAKREISTDINELSKNFANLVKASFGPDFKPGIVDTLMENVSKNFGKDEEKEEKEDEKDEILEIIKNNEYIKKSFSKKTKDESSLSSLVSIKMSQSDCIKLGVGIEKVLLEIILKKTSLKNIKTKNKKGVKEKDHLLCDEEGKKIYYCEIKTNLNLDTEKSKSTIEKCLQIKNKLGEEYKDYEIIWCLLGARYYSKDIIKSGILNKYLDIKDNVFGVNEYFNMLNISFKFDEESYKKFINNVAKNMFE